MMGKGFTIGVFCSLCSAVGSYYVCKHKQKLHWAVLQSKLLCVLSVLLFIRIMVCIAIEQS